MSPHPKRAMSDIRRILDPRRRVKSERGSGSLLTLFTCLTLATTVAMAILWSAISTARHQLAAAADLTALSAAHALPSGATDPCVAARRIAATHEVALADCRTSADSVTIRVTKPLNLPAVGTPTLTAQARAGPD
ncbi:Rv3654c family TadE-like protein [Kribbella sp. NPDC050124]|uniref:Rv3654c family TadE-like protein n=1 Tax=Kribbella sp. NPDC050124 TaxID=3364114 RepID=UPI0037994FE6